ATCQGQLVQRAEDIARALIPGTPVRYSRVPAATTPQPPQGLPIVTQPAQAQPAVPKPPSRSPPPEGPKALLLQALQTEPLHPDDLAERAGMPVERLLGLLLELELSGDIIQTPENKFALPARRSAS
ncbi:MAG TPA: hypothetical protein VL359_15935, partial [bacterium]|nr:hypothetical protein [bacterium]